MESISLPLLHYDLTNFVYPDHILEQNLLAYSLVKLEGSDLLATDSLSSLEL